jgi:cytoskeleton protein RodZ
MKDESVMSGEAEQAGEVAAPAVGPGSRLAKAREAANLSREQVAANLNLTLDIVVALERDAVTELPAAVFVRGYIKNYARLVGLRGDELVTMFEAIRTPDAPLELRPRPVPDAPGPRRGLSARSVLLVLLVLGGGLGALWWMQGGRLDVADLSRSLGTDGTPPATPVQPQPIIPAPPVVTPAPVETAPSTAPVGETATDPTATPAQDANATTAEPPVEPAPVEPPPPAEPPGHGVRLALTGDVWVEVADADGSRLVFDMLRAGTTREVRGEGPFLVLLGKASKVKVELDGRPVDHSPYERKGIARFVLDDEDGEIVTRTP